ncbi:MgtC/SapB family protein [Neorhizobium sp. LjRoot104]|uniref:MgtC/SapB family protein n=1 Tax=Neorhizobium sp. LjRoot104 TaxID=3342254 RepID=UPI003ECE4023
MNQVIASLGLALAIGLLVGLERGWRERDAPAGSRTAGIRTFGISGLLGGVMGALSSVLQGSFVFPVGFLVFALTFIVFKLREAEQDDDYSVTAVVAALVVFALGGLAVAGDPVAAAAGGAALAATLASREILHGFLKQLTWVELRSALMLAVMTAVVLPILPNHTIDPWGGLNPWEVWFFTVLTASLSFVGYIAVRTFGSRKGMLLSALAGAIVSSTAVTLVLAQSAKVNTGSRWLAGAAALAGMVSILRVVGLVSFVAPRMILDVGPAAAVAAVAFAGLGATLVLWPQGGSGVEIGAENPFEIAPLLFFAGLFAATVTVSAVLVVHFGDSGLLATVTLSGIVDVDVAVLTALRGASEATPSKAVSQAILAAMAANAFGRVALAATVGPIGFSARLAAITGAAVAAAGLTFYVTQ